MKALMTDGIWVEIDTKNIFNNQYNTTESESNMHWSNKRIFDANIIRIVDDVRLQNPELCECNYCGKKFESFADFDNHLKTELSLENHCNGCSWVNKCTNTSVEETVTKQELKNDGTKVTYKTVVVSEKETSNGCRYKSLFGGKCEHVSHSEHKRNAHTTDYFVKHPYGKLFDNFSYANIVSPDNECIDITKFVGSYKVKLNLKDFSWTLYNSKSSFTGKTSATSSLYRPTISSLDCTGNKSLQAAYNQLPNLLSNVASALIKYNEFVSNDAHYSDTDRTLLTTVSIEGKSVNRPGVIKTFWKR